LSGRIRRTAPAAQAASPSVRRRARPELAPTPSAHRPGAEAEAGFLFDAEDGRIPRANASAAAALGYNSRNLIDMKVSDLHPFEMGAFG